MFRTLLAIALAAASNVRRVEGQLLLLDRAVGETLRRERSVEVRERLLMSFLVGEAWSEARSEVLLRGRRNGGGEGLRTISH